MARNHQVVGVTFGQDMQRDITPGERERTTKRDCIAEARIAFGCEQRSLQIVLVTNVGEGIGL